MQKSHASKGHHGPTTRPKQEVSKNPAFQEDAEYEIPVPRPKQEIINNPVFQEDAVYESVDPPVQPSPATYENLQITSKSTQGESNDSKFSLLMH